MSKSCDDATARGELIRVRGLVQGVGFRPTVWRLARDGELFGDVRNDGEGVLIRVVPSPGSDPGAIERFCQRLRSECPPLARIDSIERATWSRPSATDGFQILPSDTTAVHTGIVADAATCAACAAEILDPADRRHRYPFTNCTHCGPRLSIVRGIPYDRARTSMSVFPMCPACAAEYADPADRRFHAQPNACPVCGPRVWLQDAEGRELDPAGQGEVDAIALASRLLAAGRILAVKGIGGFHLACDATNAEAVATLRRRKRRYAKPFALMARDLDVVRRYCRVTPEEAAQLMSPAAPILLLQPCEADAGDPAVPLAPGIAPGQSSLGVMLPYSPLHQLLLLDWDRPLVMTSGNLSDEPQCTDNADALARLRELADHALLHDREIVNRLDDSVVRVMAGAPRLLRRARGYAPSPIRLPDGFAGTPPILAFGGELKNALCLLRDGEAILSQHLGDLEESRTAREYERTLGLYLELFEHQPRILAADLHPDYRSSLIARDRAARDGVPLVAVQHHHAHLASVLADNGWPLDGGRVLGILFDGLGYGDDGTVWGGEFLLGDYLGYRRLGCLQPVAMPGGAQAIREPWRNLVAQLEGAGGWERISVAHPGLAVIRYLESKPLGLVRTMIARGLNTPMTSSAGRLCDAVAAALGLGGDSVSYEGQAAIELESLAARAMGEGADGYPFAIASVSGLRLLDPAPLWDALFADLATGVPDEEIAARFHRGFATSVVALGCELASAHDVGVIALSGGVFQNRLLLESVVSGLSESGLRVLLQRQVPANDGGLSLGQACVAAAKWRSSGVL